MIRIEHLEKTFPGGTTVLKDVNAVIADGDVVALIGPSGTGKSTLLRCINMLSAPTGGRIYFGDDLINTPEYPLSRVHLKVSMVFQSYNLFEHLSVIENVMLPQVLVFKRSRQEAYDRGMELLRSVGMASKENSLPSALSGGQKQRAAIARTLAMDPEIVLFDEPTSALDPASVDEVKTVIRDVVKSGVTALIVTHDMDLAKSIATRVFYMDEGIIYEEGTPEEIFGHPAREKTRAFLKKKRTMEAEVTGKDFDYPELMARICEYGKKSGAPEAVTEDLQLVTEELLYNFLFRDLPGHTPIKILYEYSAGQAEMTVSYGGEALNPLSPAEKPDPETEMNTVLAAKLLRGKAEKTEYSFTPGSGYPNAIAITLKKT